MFKYVVFLYICIGFIFVLKEDDDDTSFEQVIDNDEGEELHLQKLAQQDEPATATDEEDQPDEPSSRKYSYPIQYPNTSKNISIKNIYL